MADAETTTPTPEPAQAAPAPEAATQDAPAAQQDVDPATLPVDFEREAAMRRKDPAAFDEVDALIPDEPEPPMPGLPDEDSKLLFGMPTTRPNEPVASIGMNPYRRPIPKQVASALPMLRRMASRPDAPDELKVILTAIAREMR